MHEIKRLLILLVFAHLTFCLAACQTEKPGDVGDFLPTVAAPESIGRLEKLDPGGELVVFWHALTGRDEDALLELIDDFNANNNWGIVVVGEYQGSAKTIYDTVMAGYTAQQIPSLVMTDPSLAAAYAVDGVAVPLAPYLTHREWGFTRTEQNDFFTGALKIDQLPQFDNQMFSFPTCRSLQVMYFDADWLKELGFETPPQTWSDFREMACAASAPGDGLYGFEFGMDSALFSSLLATRDVSLLNAGATSYTLGGERGRAGLQYLQKLINNGCAQWESEAGFKFDFAVGNVLFVIDSTDELPDYESLVDDGANFAWDVTNLPYTSEEPVISSSGVSTLILPTSPEEQLAAWLFIRWLAEPEQQAEWAQHRGCLPLRRSALDQMAAYLEEHPHFASAAQLLGQVWVTEPNVTAYSECGAEIGRMLNAVTAGESLDEWLSKTLLQCNVVLADSVK